MKDFAVPTDVIQRLLESPETWTVIGCDAPGFDLNLNTSLCKVRLARGRTAAAKTKAGKKANLTDAEVARFWATKPPSPDRVAWSRSHAHRNIHWEIMLNVHGDGWFGLDGKLYPCRPGTLFLVDAFMFHDNRYPQSCSGAEHIWMYPLGDYMMVRWIRITRGRYALRYKHMSVIPAASAGIALEGFPPRTDSISSSGNVNRMRLMAGLIAAFVAQHRNAAADLAAESVTAIREDVVGSVCRLIDKTAGKGVSLHSLGHFTGYSKFHLHRLFHEKTGYTIHQYINIARFRKMQDLQGQGLTNAVIADALGFSDPSSFLRWRRKKHRGLEDMR